MQYIAATYQIRCAPEQIAAISRDICLEQTVEVPEHLVRSREIRDNIVAKVHEIRQAAAASENTFSVEIHYPVKLASAQLPQLLNLVYGNISLKRNIRLVDLDLPKNLLKHFSGPNFGVDGIRKLLEVYGRPLIATALKPRGAPVDALVRMAYDFALGGGDIVKDDHNLANTTLYGFVERVERCNAAVQKANAETGGKCLYIPNLTAPFEHVEFLLETILHLGIRGVMVAPLTLGLDTVRYLVQQHNLFIIAHPTLTGAFLNDTYHGIAPGLLLGKLFRLIGADVSIFPNAGGRFAMTKDDCREIAQQLLAPMPGIAKALPAPAGGMHFEDIPEMVDFYGHDAIFLIGGALLSNSEDLCKSTETLVAKISKCSDGENVARKKQHESSCEIPAFKAPGGILSLLPFQGDFTWKGRKASVYKATGDLYFQGVARQELIGRFGENTSFDLRYFEIEPGGYSSLEKHHH
ncbi:MAG: RuBisCO large subunit C-terminal-like domain-containing protein, partial [bacterium]